MGLISNVDDLGRWDENFYTGRVGVRQLLEKMQTVGRLANGREIGYAAGLRIARYRGLKTIGHGGISGGFRSEYLRFPEVETSVVVLCNSVEARPATVATDLADLLLKGRFPQAREAPPDDGPLDFPQVEVGSSLMDAYAGDYVIAPQAMVLIRRQGMCLSLSRESEEEDRLCPMSQVKFLSKFKNLSITFDRQDESTKRRRHGDPDRRHVYLRDKVP